MSFIINGYGGNGLYSANNSMHILIQNNCRVSSTNYGININNWLNDSITTCGVRAYAMGGGLLNSANYGVMGYGAFSNVMACGIYGGLRPLHVTCGAGVFGSANSVKIIDQNTYGGLYAGFFLGDVRVTGTLYANVLTPSALLNSKNSKQESMIQVVSSDNDIEETSVTEKLRKIQLLKIINPSEEEFKKIQQIDDEKYKNAFRNAEKALMEGVEPSENDMKILENDSNDESEVPQTRMASVRYGLAADQLKDVYPEFVYEDLHGNVSINYVEMIPLLVQSINELQEKIESLEKEKEALKTENSMTNKVKRQNVSISDMTDDMDIVYLSQNDPNPFSDRTSIKVNIPEEITNATIIIYDMSGKQIRKFKISERGVSSILITSDDMNEGMYLYSLIIDEKIFGTKKMILTK